MSTQGKAARSATGAAMSKYDVEVEARLNQIEARLAEMEVKLYQGSDDSVKAQLEDLIKRLQRKMSF